MDLMSLFSSPSPSSLSSNSEENIDVLGTEVPQLIRPSPLKPIDFSLLSNFNSLFLPFNWIQLYQLQAQQNFKPVENVLPGRKRTGSATSTEIKKPSKMRKLEDDTVTSSPVNGMFIKDENSLPSAVELQKAADELDETASYVEVTEESKKKINEITNVIGECICKLCKVKYEDVFRLAQHRCPRIAHEEYKCPDCDKVFSCPANLASHRRWHKPREESVIQHCATCNQSFNNTKQLKQHLCTQNSYNNNILQFPGLFNGIIPELMKSF